MAKQGTKAWRRNMVKAGKIGGKARDAALTGERKAEIARLGAAARWAGHATPTGTLSPSDEAEGRN